MSKSPKKRAGPVLIDLEPKTAKAKPKSATKSGVKDVPTAVEVTPANAPPVPDLEFENGPAEGRAMRSIAAIAARKPSWLVRLFWSALLALVGFAASVAAWDFATNLMARNPLLGWTATGLIGLVLAFLLLLAGRELMALGRLKRMDKMRYSADKALADKALEPSKHVAAKVMQLYSNRPELGAGRADTKNQLADQFDAEGVLALVERKMVAPLDKAAILEIEAASRQVATVTTVVPIALADLIAALTANLRMIRRIAEIYGGRSGTLGSWRLTREVLTHLVATGAVAVGDDLIGSVAGGGIMSKISRRFGEGIINGALTARVGVAAMDVCRPVPFLVEKKPSVTGLVKRALVGLFPTGT